MDDILRPKCLAKTRHDSLCQTSPVNGKKRCRMHGGAKDSGAALGNKNAFKHGRYSAEMIQLTRETNQMMRKMIMEDDWIGF